MDGLSVVFDGGPGHESGRFVEVELDGKSVAIGEWKQGENGLWYLVLPDKWADEIRSLSNGRN